jgi:DNA-binding NarL/FixJ family response regulator
MVNETELNGIIACGLDAADLLVEGRRYRYLVFDRTARQRASGLSPSEWDVACRLVDGESHKAIAAGRGTSPRTVDNQVASLFGKLGIQSRNELAEALLVDHG